MGYVRIASNLDDEFNHPKTTRVRHMLHMESPLWNHIRDLRNGRFENNGPRSLSLPPEHERKVKSQEAPGVYGGFFWAMSAPEE
jgi:hypothetical protein